jgi:D-sedoheptulose 7-phosphate isomerase
MKRPSENLPAFRQTVYSACHEMAKICRSLSESDGFASSVEQAIEICVRSLKNQGTIFFGGNGGSAVDSQHLAGELVSSFLINRAPLRSIALNADTAILTAVGNDYGYEQSLARSLSALARPGDVLVALSTSGTSKNVLAALEAAKIIGVSTIGFTGRDGGNMPPLCDLELRAPSHATPRIQEVHLLTGHLLCEGIEQRMFPEQVGNRRFLTPNPMAPGFLTKEQSPLIHSYVS